MNNTTETVGRKAVNAFTFHIELGNRPKKDGTYSLYLRITQNRKIRRIYTGFDIPLKDWNPNKKEVRRSNVHYAKVNNRIDELKAEAITIKAETKGATALTVIDHLKGLSSTSFFAFADEFTKKQAYNTSRNVRTEVNKFREYVRNDQLEFADLNPPLLVKFHQWLMKDKGNSLNTANKGLSKLRTVVGKAIEEGRMKRQDNPFLGFKMKEAKPERIRLTEEELKAFIKVDLQEGSLIWHTRNYWLFAYYSAGMRFSDVACLKWKNIDAGRLSYVMRKTKHLNNQQHTILLPKQAETILSYYRHDEVSPLDYALPILNTKREYPTEAELLKEVSRKNALLNKYLKTICFKAGIPKDLSFHSARHTFADLGRRKVGDVYAISKLLRHSKINITEKYLSDFDTEVTDKALSVMFD